MRRELMAQVLRFSVVGAVGFMVDGGVLWSLLTFDVNPFAARALSFPIAVVATWVLNRNWTFRATRDASKQGQLRRYFGVQIAGNATNYGVYSVVIAVFGAAPLPIFAGFAFGSMIGAVVNFMGARHVAFRAA